MRSEKRNRKANFGNCVGITLCSSLRNVQIRDAMTDRLAFITTFAMEEENLKGNAEINIMIVCDGKIKKLNKKFRNIDKSTDVLSFPIEDNIEALRRAKPIMLGDVVISIETALRQAAEYGNSLEHEIMFLFTHGLLHLMGYDHERGKKDEEIMFEKQRKIMREAEKQYRMMPHER